MRKNWFAMFFIIIFAVTMLSNLFSGLTVNDNTVDNGYYITSYNVDMIVGEDNSYTVTETVAVHFNDLINYGESHGIYRYIPTSVTVYRDTASGLDEKDYGINISNIMVENQYGSNRTFDVSYQNGYCVISSLSSSLVNNTDQVYVISYNYNVGYDRISNYDDFYFNIIGTQWDTSIDNITFSIQMPSALSTDVLTNGNLLMYSGIFGNGTESALSNFNIALNQNTITGSYSHLDAFNGITIKLNLPEGYFSQVNTTYFSSLWDIVSLTICLLLLLISVFIGIKNSNKNPVIETVQFYSPNGLNPTELKYILSGYITSKDLTALIIYWASKGFLKIIVDKNDKISLEKIQDLNSENGYENSIFNKIFKTNTLVKIDEMQNDLATEVFSSIPKVKLKVGTRVEPKSVSKTFGVGLLSLIPMLIVYFVYLLRYNYAWNILMFPVITSIVLYSVFLISNAIYSLAKSKGYKISNVIVSVLTFVGVIIVNAINFDPTIDYFGAIFFVLTLTFVAGFYISQMVCYKKDISEKIGKIKGFKNFIVTAEAPRLKVLLKQNPSYYYDVLPYAYVLGITDEFAKRFEGLAVIPPSWYENNNGEVFTILFLTNQLNYSLNSINQKFIKINSNNRSNISNGGFGGFGGGFGSGGFSGGGFGGGGGGRG